MAHLTPTSKIRTRCRCSRRLTANDTRAILAAPSGKWRASFPVPGIGRPEALPGGAGRTDRAGIGRPRDATAVARGDETPRACLVARPERLSDVA